MIHRQHPRPQIVSSSAQTIWLSEKHIVSVRFAIYHHKLLEEQRLIDLANTGSYPWCLHRGLREGSVGMVHSILCHTLLRRPEYHDTIKTDTPYRCVFMSLQPGSKCYAHFDSEQHQVFSSEQMTNQGPAWNTLPAIAEHNP